MPKLALYKHSARILVLKFFVLKENALNHSNLDAFTDKIWPLHRNSGIIYYYCIIQRRRPKQERVSTVGDLRLGGRRPVRLVTRSPARSAYKRGRVCSSKNYWIRRKNRQTLRPCKLRLHLIDRLTSFSTVIRNDFNINFSRIVLVSRSNWVLLGQQLKPGLPFLPLYIEGTVIDNHRVCQFPVL